MEEGQENRDLHNPKYHRGRVSVDRIIVMSSRLGKAKGIINVDLPRPRDYKDSHFLNVREEALKILEEGVLKSVAMSL